MKKDWKIKTLGEICEIYQPKTISKKEMLPNGKYPVFGANGIIGKYDQYNHEEPELLITCRGATCGSVNISLPKSWINGNAMVIRPKVDGIYRNYIEYLFRGAIDISNVITGSAQPQITRQSLSPIQIPIPPINEQKRIVEKLDPCMEQINKAIKNVEQNIQNVEELFQSYLNEIFIKKDWKYISLDEAVKKESSNLSINKLKNESGKYPLYGASGFVKNISFYNQEKDYISIVKDGAGVGRLCVNEGFSSVVGTLDCLIPSDDFNINFLFYFLQSIDFKSYVKGSTIPHIYFKDYKKEKVPYLPFHEQNRIVKLLDDLHKNINVIQANYKNELMALDQLKQSILEKAFNGEL